MHAVETVASEMSSLLATRLSREGVEELEQRTTTTRGRRSPGSLLEIDGWNRGVLGVQPVMHTYRWPKELRFEPGVEV